LDQAGYFRILPDPTSAAPTPGWAVRPSDPLRPSPALADVVRRCRTVVSEQTGLATDFLNQYNEITMLLQMVADYPDALADLESWYPKTYQEHFEKSGFCDSDLVISAYRLAPVLIRARFDAIVTDLNIVLLHGLSALKRSLREPCGAWAQSGGAGAAQVLGEEVQRAIRRLSVIINGADLSASQTDIDSMLTESEADMVTGAASDQAAIDALFD
jgi:hypothetical protein